MDKMYADIEMRNEHELLRVYENNLKNAKNENEKSKINASIANVKSQMSKLESAVKSM